LVFLICQNLAGNQQTNYRDEQEPYWYFREFKFNHIFSRFVSGRVSPISAYA